MIKSTRGATQEKHSRRDAGGSRTRDKFRRDVSSSGSDFLVRFGSWLPLFGESVAS